MFQYYGEGTGIEHQTPDNKYDIFCHHTHGLFVPFLKNYLHNNTKWITILRNPVKQFQSDFYYSKHDKIFNKTLVEMASLSFNVGNI